MSKQSNIFSEQDLRCDFPARESFREALLSRLQSINELDLQHMSSDTSSEESEDDLWGVELDDSDLELIAAAQGIDYNYINTDADKPLF